MPGCVLRVESAIAQVERLVEASRLRPVSIYRKGQPRVPGARSLSRMSGYNVDVSHLAGIKEQARDAIRFLKRHNADLHRLRRHKSYRGMTLDFGLYDRATKDRPWPTYRLPAELIELGGKLRIEIELSFYGVEPGEGGNAS